MPGEFDFGGAVPAWGRSAAEYEAFFALSDVPSTARVLDCGGGPSSFAAEWGVKGRSVVAVDPVYRFSGRKLEADFQSTSARMLKGAREAYARFVWDHYGSPEAVVRLRRNVLSTFLRDFRSATASGRYVAGQLPQLPFRSNSFDLVLCSHLLFLFSAEFDSETHESHLLEMLRVGREVRVFPLLDMAGKPSRHLDHTIQKMRDRADVEVVPVPFEFRRGDSNMLRLTKNGRG
ncbi:MAG: methyltransferase domain-containing protein [Gemmatimonadota bacterium]|nr:methyltransferase domain-containing protein [Gemmatimonadota bacterium]